MSESGRMQIIAPGERIMAPGVTELRGRLLELLDAGAKEVIFDLADVELIDSSGIGLIITTYNQIRDKNGSLIVINASAEILRIFKKMQLDKHFSICGNRGCYYICPRRNS